ncbi:MAG: SPOR domain-containing protein [Desulfobacterota bacterium]|nr:SPOR domain-containing protein [Thermodesulfobacteriota bacterium]
MKIMLFFTVLFCLSTMPCNAYGEADTYYTVQLMAASARATAMSYSVKMKAQGVETFIEKTPDTTTGAIWKVRTGRFLRKTDAEQLAASMRAQSIDCWVTTTAIHQPAQPAASSAKSDNRTDVPPVAAAGAVQHELSKPFYSFKYFNPDDNALHVTTAQHLIPERLRKYIREVTVYPVCVTSINEKTLLISISLENTTKQVSLCELTPPEQKIPAPCIRELETTIAPQQMRLRYFPHLTRPDGTLEGSLYLENGDSLACDMVRKGIARYNPERVSVFEINDFKEAEKSARTDKRCIWGMP